MADVSTSIANVVQISFKTNIKAIKIALSTSPFLESTGVVTLNINSGLTWDNLFRNIDIPVSVQRHVIRGGVKKNRIVEANLTENIYKFIGNFEKKKLYTARIEMAAIKKANLNASLSRYTMITRSSQKKRSDKSTNLNPSPPKKRRGRPPKNKNGAVSLAAGSVTIKPVAAHSNSTELPRNGRYIFLENKPSTSNAQGAKSNNNASSNPTYRGRNPDFDPILNDNGNVEEDESDIDERADDDWETESDFSGLSIFTHIGNIQKNRSRRLPSPQGGNNSVNKSNKDVKAAIAESLTKKLNNTILWGMKKEVDELPANERINIRRHMPLVGNLISKVFEEAFQQAG